jgi:O-methyltransferase involved in polyketide biosynthesis
VVRKHAIETIARRSASEGFSQLMVLGAGFDSLAFRLTSDSTFARAVEADHPDTQRVVSRSSRPHCR